MSSDEPEILSEDEAARVWEQAAQAAKEAELARASLVASKADSSLVAGQQSMQPGYALEHVRSAALEAGIAAEFVDAAVATLRSERTLPKLKPAGPMARRFLLDPPDRVTVKRTINATPREIISAMESLFAAEPYRLTLSDQTGDPLNGGVMVFDIQQTSSPFTQGFQAETREIGLKQAFISLRTMDESTPSCELTLYSPITVHRAGVVVGSILSSITGLVGGGVGLGIGAGVATLGVGVVAMPVLAIGGLATGFGLGVKGYRKLYRFAIRKGQTALEALVSAVAVRAQGGWLGS